MAISVPGVRSFEDLVGVGTTQQAGKKELGKNEFLKLMVAQINNQDPLNPTQNEQFLAQLAQFSTLEGIQNLNDSVESMTSLMRGTATTQAASLVGRTVLVPTDSALMTGEGFSGNVALPESVNQVVIEISSPGGALIKKLTLGAQAQGPARFDWDGHSEDGTLQPPGIYRVRAFASSDKDAKQFEVELPQKVVSVSLNGAELELNLAGGAMVPVSSVKEIQ
jgi:flagellar basal-body rod modification protein FlgD